MTTDHPAWCSARLCTVVDLLPPDGGEHRSEPVDMDIRRTFASGGAVGPAIAYLTKAQCAWTTATFLHLATLTNDLTMPLDQAAGILADLARLVAQGEVAE